MTEWSAARGVGRLSKRGHSFCLRSLAGLIQPPTPLQHPLPAHFPLQKRGRDSSLSSRFLSSESERPYRTISDTQGIPTGFKETTSYLPGLLQQMALNKPNPNCGNVRSHTSTSYSFHWIHFIFFRSLIGICCCNVLLL